MTDKLKIKCNLKLQPSEARQTLNRKPLSAWLPGLLSLSLGILVVGVIIGVWSTPISITAPGLTERTYHQSGFPQARSDRLLTVSKTFDLGYTSFKPVPPRCFDSYDCQTYFTLRRYDRFESITTIGFWGHPLQIVGRVWLIEAGQREVGVYVEVIQTE